MVTWRLCNHSLFPRGNRWPLIVSNSYRIAPTFHSSQRFFLHAHLWNHAQWELYIYLQMVSGVFVWRFQSCYFPMHTFIMQIMWQGSGLWLIYNPKWAKKNNESSRGEFRGYLSFFSYQRAFVREAKWSMQLGMGRHQPLPYVNNWEHDPHQGSYIGGSIQTDTGVPGRNLRAFSHALGSVFWELGQLSANGNMSKRQLMTRKESCDFSLIWGAWPSSVHHLYKQLSSVFPLVY